MIMSILNGFGLTNLVSFCMKILNSVVVVGLYYGFLSAFSIGPSYLLLIRARVMKEGNEKEAAAITGFILGQLTMFVSIYYTPLHLALGRPHTITVLVLPYSLFQFFWTNHKDFFDDGSTTRNSIRNLSIQCVFFENFIFQLLNHFVLPSPTLARLVNIYMFRYNNKILFLTSSFVGWLIGHILLMKLFLKGVGFVFFWIRQSQNRAFLANNFLANKYKYLVSELKSSMSRSRIFSMIFFITSVYYLGRVPSPILTKKLKDIPQKKGEEADIEEADIEEEKTFGTKQEEEEFKEKLKNKKKDPFWFEKPLVTLLFDYKRWNRPLRYIKNDQFETAVRDEMSQYFFSTCVSDGKLRISFTYPPSLLTFFEMIRKKLFLCTTGKGKVSEEELYNNWVHTNEQKRNNLSNEFANRIEALDKALDKESFDPDILEKRTRLYLYNDETEQKCLPKLYDPFLNGPHRGTIKNVDSHSGTNSLLITSMEDSQKNICENKLFVFLTQDFDEFAEQLYEDEGELGEEFLEEEAKEEEEEEEEEEAKVDNEIPNDQTNEIEKKVPRWSYKLLDEFEVEERLKIEKEEKEKEEKEKKEKKEKEGEEKEGEEKEGEEKEGEEGEEGEEKAKPEASIRSRKSKYVLVYTETEDEDEDEKDKTTPSTGTTTETTTNTTIGNTSNTTENTSNQDNDEEKKDEPEELYLTRYALQSDYNRDLIMGSTRAQRSKTAILGLFQPRVRSPLFLDRGDVTFFSYFGISKLLNFFFRNWIRIKKVRESKIENSKTQETKEKRKQVEKRAEDERVRISEMWDTIDYAQPLRGCLLLTQSILRKYIVLPSLIIIKNVGRMLLFQIPEWRKDWKAWHNEMHVKCTYNGVQLSENEFPKDWLTDGIQIKILFPFCLEPWHGAKVELDHRDPMKKKRKRDDFCFLTIWGLEAERPFGSPRKRPSFFKPVLKEIKKKLLVVKEKTQRILYLKIFLFLNKESPKLSPIPLLEIKEASINTNQENDIISNQIFNESSIKSVDWINYSPTVKKIKDVSDRTNIIRNQIEKIKKDKNKILQIPDINISPNETSCDDKRLESSKEIWHILKILKRRSTRLKRKCYYFLKIFIERLYIEILLSIQKKIQEKIKILKIVVKLFLKLLELKNKIFDKYNLTEKRNQERIDETNQNTIRFISTIKKLFSNTNISNKNSPIFSEPASLSQAYVFYKLSQTSGFNTNHLRSVLQYQGTLLFLKDRIKNSFKRQKNSFKRQWKNALKHYPYQYIISQTSWSRLLAKKWQKKIHQSCIDQTQKSPNFDLDEKDQLIHYEKHKNFAVDSILNQKKKLKNYKYDRLAHNWLHYKDKKESYFFRSRNEDEEFLDNYNTSNPKNVYMPVDISLNNYLIKNSDTNRNLDRKYFDWNFFDFSFKTKINIKRWTNMENEVTVYKKNKKTLANYYQIIEQSDKKDYFSSLIRKKINLANPTITSFNWMKMNEEIQYKPISDMDDWFFPELVSLYDAYRMQPWIIPINSLTLNLNGNDNLGSQNNLEEEQKNDFQQIFSNQNKLETKKKKPVQGNIQSETQKKGNQGSDLSNQEKKDKEEKKKDNAGGSDSQKPKTKTKKKKPSMLAVLVELDFFLKRFYGFQLKWDDLVTEKMINNIRVFCLLLRLENPNKIAIASIRRGELSMDVVPNAKTLTVAKLLKNGTLLVEPNRISINWDEKFIMYQILAISLIHKNKYQTNRGYQEKSNVDKIKRNKKKRNITRWGLDKSIARHQRFFRNKDKNHYDWLVLENILSPKRRRELRIRICLNSKNVNVGDRNTVFCNGNNESNCVPFFNKGRHLDKDTKNLMKLKLFLWPNYRLEDLACMNRYWFDTYNGSRFSMLRIHMYPRS
uniref:Protein TIC 214 n=1 Tax=Berberis dasystachya TaxID=1659732 RepID=A0A8K1ZSD8_9MAGN|nr:hypothetical protein RF1 [Berberis dasystachya]